MDDSKETTSSRYNRADTHMHSQRLWRHAQESTGSNQTEFQHWQKGHKVPFLTKKLFTIELMPSVKRKVIFLQWSVTGYVNQVETAWPWPGAVVQQKWKWTLCIFWGVVLVVFVWLVLFVCIFDFLFCFAFEDLGGVEGEQRLWSKYSVWKKFQRKIRHISLYLGE